MAESLLWIVITLAVGAVSGLISQRLKMPSGGLIGAMIGVLAFNLATGKAYMPIEMRLICQIISGTLVGCQISRKDVAEFRKIILPTSVLILGMFILNLCTGFLLYEYGLDLTTALFSSTPGGVTDMTLIADELGADITYVSILQLSRLIGILAILLPLLKWFYNKGWVSAPPPVEPAENAAESHAPLSNKDKYLRITGSIVVAFIGGMLATYLHIPAGGMIGSLIFAAAFNVITQKGYFPAKIRPAVRIVTGVFIGTRMQMSPQLLASCIVPILIMLTSMIVISITTAYLMHAYTGLDMGVCLFACAPAGMQEMTLIAQDLGIDVAKVAVMHLFRIATVIAVFPTLLNILLHITV